MTTSAVKLRSRACDCMGGELGSDRRGCVDQLHRLERLRLKRRNLDDAHHSVILMIEHVAMIDERAGDGFIEIDPKFNSAGMILLPS